MPSNFLEVVLTLALQHGNVGTGHKQDRKTSEQIQTPTPHLLCKGEISSSFFLIICGMNKPSTITILQTVGVSHANDIYPKGYGPGAVSGQSRFVGLFRLVTGRRAVLRRTENSFESFKTFSV